MEGFTGIDDVKTKEIHEWMKSLDDSNKQRFAINWNIPHSIFNVACSMKGGYETLQNIDWYKIYKTGDLGNWSHGGKVIVIGMH